MRGGKEGTRLGAGEEGAGRRGGSREWAQLPLEVAWVWHGPGHGSQGHLLGQGQGPMGASLGTPWSSAFLSAPQIQVGGEAGSRAEGPWCQGKGVSWHSLATAQEGRGAVPLTGQGRTEQSQVGRAGHGGGLPWGLHPPAPQESRPWVQVICRGTLRTQTTQPPSTPSPCPWLGQAQMSPSSLGQTPAVPGQSSLLLAGGELADLAAGGAGLAGGVGGGAGPALALGPGAAQLPRLRPVHAHGLGQPLAAALPVLPGLLLRHLSCKGMARVRGWQQILNERPLPSARDGSCSCGKSEPVPVRSAGEGSPARDGQGWEPETAPPSLLPSRAGLAPIPSAHRHSVPSPLDCLCALPQISGSRLAPLESRGAAGDEVTPLPPAFSAGPSPRQELWGTQGLDVFAERGSAASPGRAGVQVCHCPLREHPDGCHQPLSLLSSL